jgi:hypothetical protein
MIITFLFLVFSDFSHTIKYKKEKQNNVSFVYNKEKWNINCGVSMRLVRSRYQHFIFMCQNLNFKHFTDLLINFQ